MVQRLESIKGGGGSIRVGTTGTISALMTRELDTVKSTPQTPVSSGNKPQTPPVLVSCGATAPRRLQPRKSPDEASSSGTSNGNGIISKRPDMARKTKTYIGKSHRIPMLGSENIALERTPTREKTDKKGSQLVEIVDIKCGNPDRAWASPIAHRLKKLGFSKLSQSIL